MCSDKLRGLNSSTDPHNRIPRQTTILLNRRKSKGHPCCQQLSCGATHKDTSSIWPHRLWGEALTAGLITSPQRPPVGIFEDSSIWKGSSRGSMGSEEWGHITVCCNPVVHSHLENGKWSSPFLARVRMAFLAKGVQVRIKDNKIS